MSMLARLATVGVAPTYVDDVFSTYLYTGNGGTQTITNGIDLAGKGGLVWIKGRSGATDHALYDTARGATKDLVSNSAGIETTQSTGLTAFTASGFTVGALAKINTNADTYVSWAFREQPKFFDVVTYTGNGANRTISHNLGAVPGCIIVKRTDAAADWQVYHRSLANTEYLVLNSTAAKATGATRWNSTTPTSTVFSIGTDTTVNASGGTYVAHLFAHDAGGFGLTGADNVISCGSFTTDGGSNATVNLGYEPQWVLYKPTSGDYNWFIVDSMRKMAASGFGNRLFANLNAAEDDAYGGIAPTATGFNGTGLGGYGLPANTTYIYIAIRRGPMKTPTSGTSVFSAVAQTGEAEFNNSFSVDTVIEKNRNGSLTYVADRLRGGDKALYADLTNAETAGGPAYFDSPGGKFRATFVGGPSPPVVYWNFGRAPGFLDVVCYTGTGSATTFSHNLGVVPEMMIVKRRNGAADWWVYDAATGNTKYQVLNSTATPTTSSTAWNNTTPTSSVFSVGTGTPVNASASTYVAYLFATVAGVSKVGAYTGNGSSQTINCGFATGARFVLIKRTDSTGDWYVWDTARGIVAANDPHLSLNTTAAEVTTDDSVDPDNTGFIVNQVAATNINVTSATYIYLAIA
jgi:hypothetical protein